MFALIKWRKVQEGKAFFLWILVESYAGLSFP